jgi:hypothetical protein
VTGPSNPRGERAGTPGAGWETELRSTGEQWVPDGQPEPTANRAARRAARRGRKRSDGRTALRGRPVGPQEGREGACAPVSGSNSPQRSPSCFDPQIVAQAHECAPPTRTENP